MLWNVRWSRFNILWDFRSESASGFRIRHWSDAIEGFGGLLASLSSYAEFDLLQLHSAAKYGFSLLSFVYWWLRYRFESDSPSGLLQGRSRKLRSLYKMKLRFRKKWGDITNLIWQRRGTPWLPEHYFRDDILKDATDGFYSYGSRNTLRILLLRIMDSWAKVLCGHTASRFPAISTGGG